MKRHQMSSFCLSSILSGLVIAVIFAAASESTAEEPTPAAVANFNAYVSAVESQLSLQRSSQSAFIARTAMTSQNEIKLRRGDLIVERLTPSGSAVVSGAMLHHWRGTAFAAGAKAADFERLMKDFSSYPRHFSPQILEARVLAQHADHIHASMRVRQRHVRTPPTNRSCC